MSSWRVSRSTMLRLFPDLQQFSLTRTHIATALAIVLVTVVLMPFETSIQPLARHFRVDNPYIAYPYVAQEHVPVWLLFLLSFLLPFGLIVGSGFVLSRYRQHAISSALAFVFATVSTALVSDIFKYLIGNQRPDFLARCQPRPDAPHNQSLDVATWCTAENWARTWEGCRSTPSGHSSISFNGMGFLVFWILDTFGILEARAPLYIKLAGYSPFLVSAFIAVTRTIDHKHHWFDILFGAALGTGISYLTYKYLVKQAGTKDEENPRAEPVSV